MLRKLGHRRKWVMLMKLSQISSQAKQKKERTVLHSCGAVNPPSITHGLTHRQTPPDLLGDYKHRGSEGQGGDGLYCVTEWDGITSGREFCRLSNHFFSALNPLLHL
ncbi:hypothetical protein Bbelb_246130 [Branchiostoma belcheri]|nr:hypothetical protein Bbelb_246130 [Branchiostoma belcheri]